ncbi:MAG: hypothetical protein VCE74_03580 [Alphaproteobacteria bacterium]
MTNPPTLFHASHSGLAAALRRDPRWAQISRVLHGGKASVLKAAM